MDLANHHLSQAHRHVLELFHVDCFVGTLAQVDQGLYLVQDRYFKSLFVFWGPEGSSWQIPVMPGATWWGSC